MKSIGHGQGTSEVWVLKTGQLPLCHPWSKTTEVLVRGQDRYPIERLGSPRDPPYDDNWDKVFVPLSSRVSPIH